MIIQEQQDIYVFDVNGKEIAIPDDFIQGNHHQNENTQQDEITVIAEIKVIKTITIQTIKQALRSSWHPFSRRRNLHNKSRKFDRVGAVISGKWP